MFDPEGRYCLLSIEGGDVWCKGYTDDLATAVAWETPATRSGQQWYEDTKEVTVVKRCRPKRVQ